MIGSGGPASPEIERNVLCLRDMCLGVGIWQSMTTLADEGPPYRINMIRYDQISLSHSPSPSLSLSLSILYVYMHM